MTPKRAAWRLFVDYRNILKQIPSDYDIKSQGKQCALKAIDEILNLNFNIKCDATERCVNPVMNYWQEVKQEIEKL